MILYSGIRKNIRVGDIIGCQGSGFISGLIRKIKGGEWNWSHVSIVIRDVTNEGTGRVEVLESLFKRGMQRNYLSKIYEADHGKLFWLPMNCDEEQRKKIMELGVKILEKKTKYDYRTVWLAMFAPVIIDASKFICSEAAWYLLTMSGRLLKRFDKNKNQIAPVPGDFPTWAGVEPIELDMVN